MITTRQILQLLEPSTLGDVTWQVGPDLEDKPDRACAVTRGTGGTEFMEGAAMRGTFTLQMRGDPTKDEQPELDLRRVRDFINTLPMPVPLPGNNEIVSMWFSGLPYPLPGPDNGRRYRFVQTVNFQVTTDI